MQRAPTLKGAAWALCPVLMLFLGSGCGGGTGRSEAEASGAGRLDPVTAAVHGPRVEIEQWTVLDDPRASADTIGALARTPQGVPEPIAELWRSNGLVVYEVPRDAYERARDGLRISPTVQRRVWTGPAAWRTMVSGPRLPGGQLIELDSGTLTLSGGWLELAGRAWPEVAVEHHSPGGTRIATRMRVEIVARHMPAESAGSRARSGVQAAVRALRNGRADGPGAALVFDRLRLDLAGRGDTVLMIVPTPPGQDDATKAAGTGPTAPQTLASPIPDSGIGPEPRTEPSVEPEQDEGDQGHDQPEDPERREIANRGQGIGVWGPPLPSYPTIGRAILGPGGYPRNHRRTHVVVAVIPEPGPEQRLTPGGGTGTD